MTHSKLPATRRNGRLPSCEPCRLTKIKCDHAMPVCGRCTTRNIASRCVYHPAPMTRRPSSSKNSFQTLPPSVNVHGTPQAARSPSEEADGIISDIAVASIALSNSVGYLGPTSFASVLGEHTYLSEEVAGQEQALDVIDPYCLQSGIRVLALLSSSFVHTDMVNTYLWARATSFVPRCIIERISSSIQETQRSLNGVEGLRNWAEQVFRSSSKPLVVTQTTTFDEYCAMFTGDKLRWEVIGIVFVISGIALLTLSDYDPILVKQLKTGQDKKQFLVRLIDGAEKCIRFSHQASSSNELLVGLLVTSCTLVTNVYGDSSHLAWKRAAELSSVIYATGMHNERNQQSFPFFIQQLRRRCFAASFYMDKALATFFGRPPLINGRHCDLTPPLDLDDYIYTQQDPQVIANALGELDPLGWNAKGKENFVSGLRLRFLLSVSRDEILELSTGLVQRDDFDRRHKEIMDKLDWTWQNRPKQLRWDPVDCLQEDPHVNWTATIRLLDYRYNIFLLRREYVKQHQEGHEHLYSTAWEMLSTVLLMSRDRDLLAASRLKTDFSWVFLYYGLPCAGVLALPLLHRFDTSKFPFTRGELIRSLSVFTACLRSVANPGYGNYGICIEAEKKLNSILDQVIENQDIEPPASQAVQVAHGPMGQPAFSEPLDIFMDWYDCVNWELNLQVPVGQMPVGPELKC